MKKTIQPRFLKECGYEAFAKALPPFIEMKKDDSGLEIRPVGQPMWKTFVTMDEDILERVWEWLKNPIIFKDPKDYLRIQSALTEVAQAAIEIMVQYGNPVGRTVLLVFLDKESSAPEGQMKKRTRHHRKRAQGQLRRRSA
jgi:hypothetical protein